MQFMIDLHNECIRNYTSCLKNKIAENMITICATNKTQYINIDETKTKRE
jgi:hypothetical protein